MSTPLMTPQSERACRRILVAPPAQEQPHRWDATPRSITPDGFYYSNAGVVQYKGQVWRRPEGWYACLRWRQPVGLFPSASAAQAYVEDDVARLIATGFAWYPGE